MTDTHLELGDGREFDAIRVLLGRLGPHSTGVGDDAAVLQVPRGEQLLASVDTAIEGVHFRRDWLTPHEIGYRAVTAALSDLAAMAAHPIGVLTAIALPGAWSDELVALTDGIAQAVESARTYVLGGNLSIAAELSITTTVLGHAYEPLRRSGVRVGDELYLTGRIGGSQAALGALAMGLKVAPNHRARFAHPVARLEEGRWLASAGASAAIDISDSLMADALHLARASKVHIELESALIPVEPGVDPRAAVTSGEEYELLVATPRAFDIQAFTARFGIPLTLIGHAVAGDPPVYAHLDRDDPSIAGHIGHDHFSR